MATSSLKPSWCTLSELSINFSNIQLSLSTLGVKVETDDQALNFLHDNLNSIALPNLISLKLHHLQPNQHDWRILPEVHNFNLNLEKLEVSYSPQINVTDRITISKFQNLQSLSITHCDLEYLPASIGKLEKLEKLDLSNNKLTSLPYFIVYCKKLQFIDVEDNKFQYLPGFLQLLPNLTRVCRISNPMRTTYGNYLVRLYVDTKIPTSANIQVEQTPNRSPFLNGNTIPPLQMICIPHILRRVHNYWELNIAPAICKILDYHSDRIILCEHCYKPGYISEFYMLRSIFTRYLGLSYVPFGHYCCSEVCGSLIFSRVDELCTKISKEWDDAYKKMVNETLHQYEEANNRASNSRRTNKTYRKCSTSIM